MNHYPGIEPYYKVYRVLSPIAVVVIYEQGSGPHPGPLDYMYLYIHSGTDAGYVKMGQKNSIPANFNVEKWALSCLRKRIKTRIQAKERALEEYQSAEADVLAIRKAQESMSA